MGAPRLWPTESPTKATFSAPGGTAGIGGTGKSFGSWVSSFGGAFAFGLDFGRLLAGAFGTGTTRGAGLRGRTTVCEAPCCDTCTVPALLARGCAEAATLCAAVADGEGAAGAAAVVSTGSGSSDAAGTRMPAARPSGGPPAAAPIPHDTTAAGGRPPPLRTGASIATYDRVASASVE